MVQHITFITVNYAPEDTAIGLYTSQLAEFLVEKGYKVSVITGFPYYPKWEIPQNYIDRSNYFSEDINGVTIHRYKFYVPKKQNFYRRILHILSFNFGNVFNLKKIKQADLIFCNIPFTTNVLLGLYLRWRLKAKLWTSIKDFEFDAAYEAGLVKPNIISNIFRNVLHKIENYLFTKSDVVSSISLNMVERIKLKAPKTDPFFFPDWVDINFINPSKYKQHHYISKDKFTVLYSGNIGQKQNWEVYINLAKKLIGYQDIEFVLVGEGGYKKELLSTLKEQNLLGFIKYYEPIPYEDLPDLLCSADLHILFQKNDVIDSVMPSKILGMMSSSRPSVITGDFSSEVARHINLSQGWGYFNNDVEAILNAILLIKGDPNLQEKLGEKARKYMIQNFSKEIVLKSFLEKINDL